MQGKQYTLWFTYGSQVLIANRSSRGTYPFKNHTMSSTSHLLWEIWCQSRFKLCCLQTCSFQDHKMFRAIWTFQGQHGWVERIGIARRSAWSWKWCTRTQNNNEARALLRKHSHKKQTLPHAQLLYLQSQKLPGHSLWMHHQKYDRHILDGSSFIPWTIRIVFTLTRHGCGNIWITERACNECPHTRVSQSVCHRNASQNRFILKLKKSLSYMGTNIKFEIGTKIRGTGTWFIQTLKRVVSFTTSCRTSKHHRALSSIHGIIQRYR